MKIYQILKTYPGLNPEFKVGDVLYNCGEEYDGYAYMNIYKKILHQQTSPSIFAPHVEDNPEFFKPVQIEIKIVDEQ